MSMNDVSIPDLIRSAIVDARDLVRAEFALAKAEAREEVRRIGAGAAMLAGAAVAGLVGFVLLLTTVAWALSELLEWPVWAGFGVVTAVVLLATGVLAYVGLARLRAQRHMPRTVDTLKESMQWMRARTS
jgi:hypothetical protein